MSRRLIDDQTPPHGDFVRYLDRRIRESAAVHGVPTDVPPDGQPRAAARHRIHTQGELPALSAPTQAPPVTSPGGVTGGSAGALPGFVTDWLNQAGLGRAKGWQPGNGLWWLVGAILLGMLVPALSGLIFLVLVWLGWQRVVRKLGAENEQEPRS